MQILTVSVAGEGDYGSISLHYLNVDLMILFWAYPILLLADYRGPTGSLGITALAGFDNSSIIRASSTMQ